MMAGYLRLFCGMSLVLLSVSGASIKENKSERPTTAASAQIDQKQSAQPDEVSASNDIHRPLISRGYDNDGKPEYVTTYTTSHDTYNPLTVIALSVLAVLGLLLFLQLLGIQTVRSLGGSSWLPGGDWNIGAEDIPQIMNKVANWVENLPGDSNGILKRTVRDVTSSGGQVAISDWITAYKKDPVEYQYIRKLACQTLGKSELAQRSVESQWGKTMMSALEYFMEDGSDIVDTIHDVIGHPEKCMYITFVDEDEVATYSRHDETNLKANSIN